MDKRRGVIYIDVDLWKNEMFNIHLSQLHERIKVIKEDLVGRHIEYYCTCIHFKELNDNEDIPIYTVMFTEKGKIVFYKSEIKPLIKYNPYSKYNHVGDERAVSHI